MNFCCWECKKKARPMFRSVQLRSKQKTCTVLTCRWAKACTCWKKYSNSPKTTAKSILLSNNPLKRPAKPAAGLKSDIFVWQGLATRSIGKPGWTALNIQAQDCGLVHKHGYRMIQARRCKGPIPFIEEGIVTLKASPFIQDLTERLYYRRPTCKFPHPLEKQFKSGII